MPSIWELKETMGSKQFKALNDIFDAVRASSEIELNLGEAEASVLSRPQMGLLWARARNEVVGDARNRAKEEWLEAEREYAKAVQRRIEEIHKKLFAPTRGLSTSEMLELMTAGEDTLDSMFTLSLESGNIDAARCVLHVAHERQIPEILARWREEVENGEADLDMLAELDQAPSAEELEQRLDEDLFERAAPDPPTVEDLLPRPGMTPTLLK
jgi:hypothetical protein